MRENRRLAEQLSSYVGMLSKEAHGEFNFGAIVGESPALRDVLARVEQVAQTSSTVLLRGETGTGKEMVARAIHINSARESRPFVRVNCAALAPGVLESELFGHEKGSFTGAMARRLGRFELADGGTLFLDEVGDLPLDVQVKLLRVLQEREFERVGGSETIKVDVRVVSATHRDLEQPDRRRHVPRGSLLPPERLPDRAAAAARAHQRHRACWPSTSCRSTRPGAGKPVRGLDAGAVAALSGYAWPGNVRELENVIERALILARGPEITAADLEFTRRPTPPPAPAAAAARRGAAPRTAAARWPSGCTSRSAPRSSRAIDAAQGNIAHAARALGINRSTLYYRMRKHGLEHLLPMKDAPASSSSRTGP